MNGNKISIVVLLFGIIALVSAEFSSGAKSPSISSAIAGEMNGGFYVTPTQSIFEDAVVDLENAIVNQGLVIDYKGMVGDMLERTQEAVGAKTPYKNAVYMQFCSAKHTHAVVSADIRNVAVCPYVVFVYEDTATGSTTIGYRRPIGVKSASSDEAVASIDKMLEAIVNEAAEGL